MKIRWMLVALALVAAACGGPAQNANRRLVRRRVNQLDNATSREDHSRCDATRPGRTASEYDTNGDGVPDVRKVYQTSGEGVRIHAVLVCREVDLNHDGTKDMFRFYSDEGRTLREEEDRDFDGRIDVITYFENGEVVRREMDTNSDGQVDMRIFYREHRPYRAEREVNGDHDANFNPDYWEFYDVRGHVVRIGWDYDRDGRADRWDRVDRITPGPGAAFSGSPQPSQQGQGAQPAPGANGANAPARRPETGTQTQAPAGDAGGGSNPSGVAPR